MLIVILNFDWDYCHITEKYRGSTQRDCNAKVLFNHKIPVAFYNLKNYGSYLIMHEQIKFNFNINVIPNLLKKLMSFSINNKLISIDSFQFLSPSLVSLVKIWVKMILNIWVENLMEMC